jgi:peptide deformylase
MSALPLCIEPHPALRRPSRPVDARSEEVQRLARDMIDTMYANDGIGLAAPQVGRDLQLFVANPSQIRGKELVMLNPMLDEARGRTSLVEGCLSLPEVWERVTRAARVRIQGQDLSGNTVTIEAAGLMAIVLQHELDHLQGRLFIDRLSWFRRRRLQDVIQRVEGAERHSRRLREPAG